MLRTGQILHVNSPGDTARAGTGATLLACDIDLDRVARVIGVELDQPA